MEDRRIIALFWQRSEEAITAAERKYGGYCRAIACNILRDREDSEECVSDTWLTAWNTMPPQRPDILRAFLGRIARNLAFDRYRSSHAAKRGGGEMALVLDELAECVSGGESVQEVLDRELLVQAVNDFLTSLPSKKRTIFLRRYWYADPVSAIASDLHMTPGSISAVLHRLRGEMRYYLTERGFDL